MKKKFILGLISIVAVLGLVGCSLSLNKSYIYNVTTGDQIKVTLKTSDGYDMNSEDPFIISKEGTEIAVGQFVYGDKYAEVVKAIQETEGYEIIDSGIREDGKYTFYSYNGVAYYYLIMIDNSSTALLLANPVSEESAKDCFDRLTFSKQ